LGTALRTQIGRWVLKAFGLIWPKGGKGLDFNIVQIRKALGVPGKGKREKVSRLTLRVMVGQRHWYFGGGGILQGKVGTPKLKGQVLGCLNQV